MEQFENMSLSNNSTLSPFVYYCSEILLPPEYFLTSILITSISFLFVVSLLIFVAVKARKVKRDLVVRGRTWITALDFIGGIGGVDSVFESYENFLGKNRQELEKIRRDNIEHRRHSEPGWVTGPSDVMTEVHNKNIRDQRSRSNMERIRLVRSDSDEEAEFYLRVLQYPDLLVEHNKAAEDKQRQERSGSLVSILKRRLSLASTETESGSVGESCHSSPSHLSRVTTPPGVSRTLRSSSLDQGLTKRSEMYRKNKKPSVIQEINEV